MTLTVELQPDRAVTGGGIVPRLSDADRLMLQRMALDLEIHVPQRGRLVATGNPELDSDTVYARGVRGSGVADDVRVLAGASCSNADVAAAVDDLLNGRERFTKLHVAALYAMQGYAAGHLHGLVVPADALDAPAPEDVEPAPAAAEEPEDDDIRFESWSHAVDALAAEERAAHPSWSIPAEWIATGPPRRDALRAAFERSDYA